MTKVRYRLPKGIRLKRRGGEFFCIREVPLKTLRVNEALFNILKGLEGKGTIEDVCLSPDKKDLFERLAQKGILEREEVPEPTDLPSVSVIIPVKNRAQELKESLQALEALIYPRAKVEILVVDDASTDTTFEVAQRFSAKTFRMKVSLGQGACRNFAARRARGDILAFLDSDCMASPGWLNELVPYLTKPGIGAVGGYVDGYFSRTHLDRYEKTCSPLNMGGRPREAGTDPSHFYLPSCNFLVHRDIFLALGGFDETLHVGEDVEFCWRLRKAGYTILYIPKGVVYHKHRCRLLSMLKRRFDYGTSEAILTLRHPEKIKEVSLSLQEGILWVAISFFLLFPSFWSVMPLAGVMLGDLFRKCILISRKGIPDIPFLWILSSTLRWGFSSLYGISSFIVRYYLLLLLITGCFFHKVWILTLICFMVASLGFRLTKRPRLSLLPFLAFFFLEGIAYQLGVLQGCMKYRNYRPLLLRTP